MGYPSVTNDAADSLRRLRETEREAKEIVQRARDRAHNLLADAERRISANRRAALDEARSNAAARIDELLEEADVQIKEIDRKANRRIEELKRTAERTRDKVIDVLLAEVLA